MEEDLLIRGLAELKMPAPRAYIDAFSNYLEEIARWNRAYNITSLRAQKDIVAKHFLDSLLYLTFIPPPVDDTGHRVSVGDIGSGAGFPGVPLGIVRPDLLITLIEPSRKKAAFLRHMRRTLHLENLTVAQQRVEEMPPEIFDIAVTRALFSIKDIAGKARHVLKEKGFFILSKGPKVADELSGLPACCRAELRDVRLDLAGLRRTIVKVTC